MSVLVVGSIALDTVKTPMAEHADLLGGSASYAALGASFFSPVNLVGVVGDDFPKEHVDLFRDRRIDLDGLQTVTGKTFRWSGEYMWDLNTRETRSVELNVFEHFTPTLPGTYADTPVFLLANIGPNLQNHVLDQAAKPNFIIADTMDLWINIALDELLRLLKRVDMLILNDGEARQLTKETSLIKAAAKIRALGPKYVVIKKGEHGALLFGDGKFFSCGAYPLEDIHDPTGAGDTFAGGLAGWLAAQNGRPIDFDSLRKAVVYGSILASFNVEAFSLERLRSLTQNDIAGRYEDFRLMQQFEVLD
ncbi:MAG TPA: PfkB family carbohydrate kinase [Chthoniobacteraceae bacterium]|jgi:sugar/nucleoside kinase (ribokinase family)|nr:PfkB family carbohydrate kinase [Chthoniobacteraceae bacterium]